MKISVVVPAYNEEENVIPLSKAITQVLENKLSDYDYELIFIDNNSTDNTRYLLRDICNDNKKIKAILNAKNFGQFNSPFHALKQTSGDCVVLISADFQDPIDLIPELVSEWEKGYKIVTPIKTTSSESKIMWFIRSCYYKMIKKFSTVEQIEHFTGWGLYDKSFIQVLRDLDDPTPFLRGIVAELGFKRKEVPYEQQKRAAGVTKNNWASLYDAAMLSFTSYTTVGIRVATISGFCLAVLSLLIAFIYMILKLIWWDSFGAGTIPILMSVCIFSSAQLFFIGLLG